MRLRKIISLKIFLVTLTSFSLLINTGSAQSSHLPYEAFNEEPLTVKYLGVNDEYLVFEVTLKAGSLKNPFLQIEDEMAGEIYSETISANTKTIKFRIEKGEDQSLSFYLISGKKTYARSFSENDFKNRIAIKY